jgi:hypothetical protein
VSSKLGAIQSRFFEKGLNPVEVATITGHKDPRMLKRYAHLSKPT